MRFRKVRSYLSAYCNGELTGKARKAMQERLTEDASLREEEQALRLLHEATKKVPGKTVSDDFNSRLLNRIAGERFAETRSKAMLPRTSLPLPLWGKLAPVVVTAAVILALSVSWDFGTQTETNPLHADRLSDSYLTAQPDSNPNMAVAVDQGWSMERTIQQSQRASQYLNRLASGTSFYGSRGAGTGGVVVRRPSNSPFEAHYFRVVPVQTVYQVSNVRRTNSTY